MDASYCYWSVCDGSYAALMENCVRSARASGVFKEFHLLCDRPVQGCHCYEAYECDKADGLFKLHYLKVGMSRLSFDFFVWIDADTIFLRNPTNVLATLGKSPIHVPLEFNLSAMGGDREWKGYSCFALREALRRAGVQNQAYLCQSAFWIVHHDAIDRVYELALEFWNRSKEALQVRVDAALGYAMQMLCGNPEAHLLGYRPDLWASGEFCCMADVPLDGQPWSWRHPLSSHEITVRPAIVHLPGIKRSTSTG